MHQGVTTREGKLVPRAEPLLVVARRYCVANENLTVLNGLLSNLEPFTVVSGPIDLPRAALGWDHSARSTNTGSVRDARRAGIAVAINVIAATTIVAVARTIGSAARMP
jgi:hypothetical protein